MNHAQQHGIAGDRLLGFAARALVLVPIVLVVGQPDNPLGIIIVLTASFIALAMRRGIRGAALGFALLWGALGLTAGLVVLGIFSVGPLYLIAAIFLAVVIGTAPNETGRSRVRLPYLLAEPAGFGIALMPFVLL